MAEAVVVKERLPLPHHAEEVVVENGDLERQSVRRRHAQLLGVHDEAAVAADADHRQVASFSHAEGRPHCRGHSKAHRAEAAGGDVRSRLAELIVLGRPHLMLPHVADDDRVALRFLVDLVDHVLRGDQVLLVGMLVGVGRTFLAPFLNLVEPVGRVLWLDLRQQLLEDLLRVANHGAVGVHVLGDARRVDVDVDDLGLWGPGVHLAGHAVVEPGAHGHDEVGVLHGLIGVVEAVHAQPAERQIVGLRKGPEPMQRRRHRNVGLPGQLGEVLRRVGVDGAAAHVQERALGVLEHLGRPVDLLRSRLARHAVAREVGFVRVAERRRVHLHVLRDVDHDRAGTTGPGNVIRLFDGRGQLVNVPHQEVVLRDATGDPGRVRLLKAVVSDQVGGHLSGEDDNGDRVHVGVGDARDGVGGAGAAGHEDRADATGGFGVAFRRVRAALLVPDEHVLEGGLDLLHGVVDLDHRAAGMAEDAVDALFFKGANEDLRALEGGGIRRPIGGGGGVGGLQGLGRHR